MAEPIWVLPDTITIEYKDHTLRMKRGLTTVIWPELCSIQSEMVEAGVEDLDEMPIAVMAKIFGAERLGKMCADIAKHLVSSEGDLKPDGMTVDAEWIDRRIGMGDIIGIWSAWANAQTVVTEAEGKSLPSP